MTERNLPPIDMAAVRTDITKEEAARRQIDRAVLMIFEGDDDVCTHVLTASAAEIVADVCHRLKVPSSRDSMVRMIRPEKLEMFKSLHKQPYNYFKHGDRDHNQLLPFFNPGATQILLLFAMHDYRAAYRKQTVSMLAFSHWMMALYPDMFTVSPKYALYLEMAKDLRAASKDEQRRTGLSVLRELEKEVIRQPGLLDVPATD